MSFTRPLRVLYVDFAPRPGGSIQSLLLVLRHLPREQVQPLVLLAPAADDWPAVHELNIPVFTFDAQQGTPIPVGATAAQVRKSESAQKLRSHPWLGRVWRWGSISRRLWRRSRVVASFIARLAREQQIDVLHMNDALPLAEPGVLAAWRVGKPSVVTSRSFNPLDDFHRWLSRLPAAGIFTSAAIQRHQREQGARFRREYVIPNAVDLAQFDAVADRTRVRREFGLPQDARIITVVGRIMRRKGIDVFIRAMAEVARRHPDVIGLVVGGEAYLEPGLDRELKALARDLGLEQRIHFTGFREDVPRILLASDLLSFVPTEPEPFGRTVIEAMAAGLPVVAANTAALPDLVLDGETGLLVPPANPSAQAAALNRLLSDHALMRKMGRAGRERARLFGIERHVTQ
ncbi:MAG: glycosyltransferase family 4 protein, partial [Chloroflexi bacterium]|nr:glycosyltransferase family 4 protein [Chloroflexota bacterium]